MRESFATDDRTLIEQHRAGCAWKSFKKGVVDQTMREIRHKRAAKLGNTFRG